MVARRGNDTESADNQMNVAVPPIDLHGSRMIVFPWEAAGAPAIVSQLPSLQYALNAASASDRFAR